VSEGGSSTEELVRRVKKRVFVIAAVGIAAAFAFGVRPGVSLTICAAVVVSSFLALEKLIDRLAPGPGGRSERRTLRLVPLILVTLSSFALLGLVLWKWKGFDPAAGAAGLSVVVLAIVPEVWSRR
jgi:hypothetical protein